MVCSSMLSLDSDVTDNPAWLDGILNAQQMAITSDTAVMNRLLFLREHVYTYSERFHICYIHCALSTQPECIPSLHYGYGENFFTIKNAQELLFKWVRI